MKAVFFSEIEPFPCAVLKSHFPDVPNLGDMSKIEVKNEGKEITNGSVRIVLDERLDIFAGGTPCQDVSVAGKRRGMEEGSNTRSSLAFEFVRLVRELRPRFVIWENVAGVLSDKSFPEFLTALANCGYGVAYRTLDAQWVRVADCHHEDGGVVRKWLEKITNPDTCPDAPRYKGCGNGWATNQPRWILLRLLAVEGIDPWWGEFDEAKEAKENSDVSDN
jgi:hypothetical protein